MIPRDNAAGDGPQHISRSALLRPAALHLSGQISPLTSPIPAAPGVRRAGDSLAFLRVDVSPHCALPSLGLRMVCRRGTQPPVQEEKEKKKEKEKEGQGERRGETTGVCADFASSSTSLPNFSFVFSSQTQRTAFAATASSSFCSSSVVSGESVLPVTSLREALYASGGTSTQRNVFSLFGTLERGDFNAFTELFSRHRAVLDTYIERVLQRCVGLYPPEVDLLDFLRHPATMPSVDFFRHPVLSWPLHALYATACFYATARRFGYRETFDALRQRGAVCVTGKALFGALAVSMSPTEEELIHHTACMFRAAFFVGLVLHEVEVPIRAHMHQCARKGFLLLVVNISGVSLRLLLDRVNAVEPGGAIPLSIVTLSRVVGPRAGIVCGHPLDLQRFIQLLLRYAAAAGTKIHYDFLPSLTPENNAYYNQKLPLHLLRLWGENGVEMHAAALHLTVLSPVDGEPWGPHAETEMKGSFAERIARAVTCESQDITCATRHLREGDVLLNFCAAILSVGHLATGARRGISVIMQPSDFLGRGSLLSPRRSSGDNIIQATFAKCAHINEVLRSMQGELPPAWPCVAELATSFVEMGLLLTLSTHAGDDSISGTADTVEVNRFTGQQETSHATKDSDVGRGVGGAINNHNAGGNHYSSGFGKKNILDICGATNDFVTDVARESQNYVISSNEHAPSVINVYQVSPLITYYELQSNCVLTPAAVEFARRLAVITGLAFPPHTLLMCPTVLALLELWDTFEFLYSRENPPTG